MSPTQFPLQSNLLQIVPSGWGQGGSPTGLGLAMAPRVIHPLGPATHKCGWTCWPCGTPLGAATSKVGLAGPPEGTGPHAYGLGSPPCPTAPPLPNPLAVPLPAPIRVGAVGAPRQPPSATAAHWRPPLPNCWRNGGHLPWHGAWGQPGAQHHCRPRGPCHLPHGCPLRPGGAVCMGWQACCGCRRCPHAPIGGAQQLHRGTPPPH